MDATNNGDSINMTCDIEEAAAMVDGLRKARKEYASQSDYERAYELDELIETIMHARLVI